MFSFHILVSGAKKGYRALLLLVFSVAFLLLSSQMSYVAEAASGDLDSSFGMGGVVRTDFFGLTDEVRGIALQSDNRVVAVGTVVTPAFGSSFGLARYNPNGSLDLTFGSGGKVITDLGGTQEAAEDVAIQPDGKIVVAGHTGAPYSSDTSDFVVVRYITLQDFAGNRRVLARIDGGANRATAAVQVLSLATIFTITDRDTRNNNCNCP